MHNKILGENNSELKKIIQKKIILKETIKKVLRNLITHPKTKLRQMPMRMRNKVKVLSLIINQVLKKDAVATIVETTAIAIRKIKNYQLRIKNY